jgi:hypothetical protein
MPPGREVIAVPAQGHTDTHLFGGPSLKNIRSIDKIICCFWLVLGWALSNPQTESGGERLGRQESAAISAGDFSAWSSS